MFADGQIVVTSTLELKWTPNIFVPNFKKETYYSSEFIYSKLDRILLSCQKGCSALFKALSGCKEPINSESTTGSIEPVFLRYPDRQNINPFLFASIPAMSLIDSVELHLVKRFVKQATNLRVGLRLPFIRLILELNMLLILEKKNHSRIKTRAAQIHILH